MATAVVLLGLIAACGMVNPTPSDLPGYWRAPWVLDAVPGAELELRVVHGCSRLAGVDAVESEERVEVRAWVGPTGDEGCFPALRHDPRSVVLDAPLWIEETDKKVWHLANPHCGQSRSLPNGLDRGHAATTGSLLDHDLAAVLSGIVR